MSWYFENGKEADVVVSTRIRFARNISGIKFENKMTKEDEIRLFDQLKDTKIKDLKFCDLSKLDDITKMSLVEKHILSKEILNKKMAGFFINEDESVCVMLNEEDHVRIQVIKPGLDFEETYKEALKIDTEISKIVTYAYNNKYGYLTTCPTNLGTGLRVSVMLHLPALRITGRIQKVLDVVNKINVTVRGVYGEGTDAIGDLYQVSNKISLGISEEEIINSIEKITDVIIRREREAREFLKKQGIEFEDKISRIYGTLLYAKKLNYNECAKLISSVKLGVDMGIIKDIGSEKVNKIQTLVKPASLQKYSNKKLEASERDIKRAELIREILS